MLKFLVCVAMWLSYRNGTDTHPARSEHSAYGPIGQVWGNNVGLFYNIGTKLGLGRIVVIQLGNSEKQREIIEFPPIRG